MDQANLSVPQAAARIGIDQRTLRSMIARGQVATIKLGARLYIPEAEVTRILTPSADPTCQNRQHSRPCRAASA